MPTAPGTASDPSTAEFPLPEVLRLLETTQKIGYRPELDGFRALAILVVLAFHTEWSWLHTHAFSFGWRGVDLFFVLSGFLITSLLLREHSSSGRISRRRFYERRAARLLPALVLAVAVGAVVAGLYGNGPWSDAVAYPRAALATLLFGGNWMGVHKLGLLGHTWSLALEEQYYLVWPAALGVALRRGVSRARMAGAASALACLVAALRWMQDHGRIATHVSSLDARGASRSDGILIGTALALVLASGMGRAVERALRDRALAAAVGICAVALVVRPAAFHMSGNDAILPLNLCFAILIGHAFVDRGSRLGAALGARPLPAIGRISYGLYLFHWPIFVLAAHLVARPLPSVALALTASFAVACASLRLVEQPLRALAVRSQTRTKHRDAGIARTPASVPALAA